MPEEVEYLIIRELVTLVPKTSLFAAFDRRIESDRVAVSFAIRMIARAPKVG